MPSAKAANHSSPVSYSPVRVWILGVSVVASIWLCAAFLIVAIRSTVPTAQSITDYAASHQLQGKSVGERLQIVTTLATKLNFLDYQRQREMVDSTPMKRIYSDLDSVEKERFLQLTIPHSMRNLLQAASTKPAAQRKKFIAEAVFQVDTLFSKDQGAGYNVRRVQGWLKEGLREAFFNLPSGTRIELKPIIQQTMPELAAGF